VVPFQRYDDDCGRQAFTLPKQTGVDQAEERGLLVDRQRDQGYLPGAEDEEVRRCSRSVLPSGHSSRNEMTKLGQPEMIGFMGVAGAASDVQR